jgi:hypothetical protein
MNTIKCYTKDQNDFRKVAFDLLANEYPKHSQLHFMLAMNQAKIVVTWQLSECSCNNCQFLIDYIINLKNFNFNE